MEEVLTSVGELMSLSETVCEVSVDAISGNVVSDIVMNVVDVVVIGNVVETIVELESKLCVDVCEMLGVEDEIVNADVAVGVVVSEAAVEITVVEITEVEIIVVDSNVAETTSVEVVDSVEAVVVGSKTVISLFFKCNHIYSAII